MDGSGLDGERQGRMDESQEVVHGGRAADREGWMDWRGAALFREVWKDGCGEEEEMMKKGNNGMGEGVMKAT